MPVLRLDGFEGPLDLLLDLARAQRVDLARISIGALVEQYLALLALPGSAASLAQRGDWLVAASWLTLLKSRLLLPAATPEAGEGRRDAARLRDGLRQAARRAEARVQALALARWLEARPQLGAEIHARGQGAAEAAGGTGLGDLLDLLLACFDVYDAPAGRVPALSYAPPGRDTLALAEALARLGRRLEATPGGSLRLDRPPPEELAAPPLRRRSAVASTFLAALELARQGRAGLRQEQGFGALWLTGRAKAGAFPALAGKGAA
ncbi:segregation/condensation protein A [Teichococcus rhizosphaerae]|nr:segregation/condensation protein A [Pseudoroseomonas rhizosphaerae]